MSAAVLRFDAVEALAEWLGSKDSELPDGKHVVWQLIAEGLLGGAEDQPLSPRAAKVREAIEAAVRGSVEVKED